MFEIQVFNKMVSILDSICTEKYIQNMKKPFHFPAIPKYVIFEKIEKCF